MFTEGKPNKNSNYPLPAGHPKRTLQLDRQVATVVDVDGWVNPWQTTCDAYVLTDKGLHLFWLHPNTPSGPETTLNDKAFVDLNVAEPSYPLFFEAKHTQALRSCVAKNEAGLTIANAYNQLATKLHEKKENK